jgi:hypothetical protein
MSWKTVLHWQKMVLILFYPRRKTNWLLKEILGEWPICHQENNMAVTKSANINWVKDIYLEQEFEVKWFCFPDYLMSDFVLNKKRKFQGWKRTSYRNQQTASTRMRSIIWMTKSIKNQRNTEWESFENLKNEFVYKMLDTLQTVNRFKQLYSMVLF